MPFGRRIIPLRQCMAFSDASTSASWHDNLPDHYPPLPPGAPLPDLDPAFLPQLWLPGHIVISGTPWSPAGRVQQRYSAQGLTSATGFSGGLHRPHLVRLWLQAGARFRVLPDSEPGVLRLDAEKPTLSYLHCGAPGSAASLSTERVWADNWVREIMSRVPTRSRRRAAVWKPRARHGRVGRPRASTSTPWPRRGRTAKG